VNIIVEAHTAQATTLTKWQPNQREETEC